MQAFRIDPQLQGTGYPIIGVNSGVNNLADAQYADSNGFLAVATTSSKILGFSAESSTNASDNQTVAKLTPLYVPALGTQMVYSADQACVQTDIGAYADLGTATSGAQVLNLSAGATGQFFVYGFDPYLTGDTTVVVVETAEPQVLAFAQS